MSQTVASGANPSTEQPARLTAALSKAREGHQHDPPLGEVLFDLECACKRSA